MDTHESEVWTRLVITQTVSYVIGQSLLTDWTSGKLCGKLEPIIECQSNR